MPPQLPQSDDLDPYHERILLTTTIQALQEFQTHLSNPEQNRQVQSVVSTVTSLLNSRNNSGYVSETQLAPILADLGAGAACGAVLLEIKAQNAGILISKRKDSIIVESFELSPTNQDAIAAKGRLIRSFPAYASMINVASFQEEGLRATLAQTIAKLSSQPAPGFQPQVRKANQYHDEMRDTTHPGMVTNFLMNVTSALGEATHVSTIWKNTREEVLWSQSKQPWRRSPLWLLLRVSMQLQFSRAVAVSESNESLYKPFMVFLLSKVLSLASRHHQVLGAEILYTVSAKLSRRIKKLGTLSQNAHTSQSWMNSVCETLFSTHDLISNRWKYILDQTGLYVDAKVLEELRPENDLHVDLPELSKFIVDMTARKPSFSTSEFQPTAEYPKFSAQKLPCNVSAYGEYQYFQLAAVESWVEHHLARWLEGHIGNQNSAEKLRDLIQAYHASAKSIYADLPGSMSIMYLTIMELWTACDKSACHIHPLLSYFNPEVPIELMQSLLLPLKDQMRRLRDVENYIQSRRTLASQHAPSLFRDFGHPSSFAVKFFDQSPLHQALLSQIEQNATNEKHVKCTELSNKKQEYRNYMEQYNRISDCDTRWIVTDSVFGTGEYQHDPSCRKCYWETKADNIEIQVHEWPLSSNPSVAKSVVFELDVPEAFSNWRDVTIFLLKSVFESTYRQERPRTSYALRTDQGLSSFFSQTGYGTRRIVVLSQVKPNNRTHRNQKGRGAILNLTEDDVCVNNGLQYKYLDKTDNIFTDVLRPTDKILQSCTYKLPARSSNLQKYLLRSPSQPDGVPPNEVIANQSECSAHVSLDEYKAFSAVPLGHRIQYANILTQLSMPTVDFAKVETQLLILQIILQAGCPSTQSIVERAAHGILTEESFGNAMINQLEISLRRVSENWESWRALASFVQQTTRLLTLATSSNVQSKCRVYLDKARMVSFGWLNTIKSRAHTSTDDGQRAELYSRAAEIALLCVSTFDMDQYHVNKILHEPSAASILLQCSIVVQENKDAVSPEHKPLYCAMLQSWRSLTYRNLSTLKDEIICHGNICLDDAVTASWPVFRSASFWHSLGSPQDHWLVTKSKSKNSGFGTPTQIV